MIHRFSTLAGRLRAELSELERTVRRAEKLMRQAQKTGDDGYVDGVALNLHAFYSGIEHLLETIGNEIDGSLPSGQDWHRDLLIQMTASLPEIRPPVLQRETRNCLDEYRSFRHVVRHVYTFQLKAARVQQLVDDLADCYHAIQRDIETFARFLEKMAADE